MFVDGVVAMAIGMIMSFMHMMPDAHCIVAQDKHMAVVIELHDIRQGTELISKFFYFSIVIAYYMMYVLTDNTVPHFGDIIMIFEYKISQVDQDIFWADVFIDIFKNMAGHLILIFEVAESRWPGRAIGSADAFV